jgi:hypothetical protein
MILRENSRDGGYTFGAIQDCSDTFSLPESVDLSMKTGIFRLRGNLYRYPAPGWIRNSIARLGFVRPLDHQIGDAQAPQQRCDFLGALFRKPGLFGEMLSVR